MVVCHSDNVLEFRCPRSRGYTLVELMVVVALIGILAVVSLAYVGRHAAAAKAKEGLATVQSIKAAQEHYRSLNGVYLDASQASWFPRDPLSEDGTRKQSFHFPIGSTVHGDAAAWRRLNPEVPGPVRFGYLTNAGLAGSAMTALEYVVPDLVWPATTEAWYVVQAHADINDDGIAGYYVASSLTGAVYSKNVGE